MNFVQFVEDASTRDPKLRKEFSDLIQSPQFSAAELCRFFKAKQYQGISDEDCSKIYNAITHAGKGMVGGAVIQY